MMLGNIRNYVRQRGAAPVRDIALHFDISVEAARFALDYWERKGKIRQQTTATSCSSGGCSGCGNSENSGDNAVYEWIGRDIVLNWHPLH